MLLLTSGSDSDDDYVNSTNIYNSKHLVLDTILNTLQYYALSPLVLRTIV